MCYVSRFLCSQQRGHGLVNSNEQSWNEQRYLSLCFTSYSHRLADENILRVNILRVYSLRLLLFFKIKHSIKFRATWLWISANMTLVPGDMTSGEMTFGRLDRLPLECEWYRRNNQLKEIPINASYTDVTIDRNRFLRVRELVTERRVWRHNFLTLVFHPVSFSQPS